MGWKRWILIGVVLAGVVLAILFGFRVQPALVETAEVKRGPLRVTIEEEGKTRVTDRFVVSAPLAGYMRRITLEEGDTVLERQVIARLEPLLATALDPRSRAETEARVSAAQSAVAAARERVRSAQVDVRYAKDELVRIEQLVKSGDMPRERYDRAVVEERRASAALSEAQQMVEVAEAEVRAARAALQVSPQSRTGETIAIRSPVSGRVLKVVRDSEGVVNSGESLVELGSVRSLEVVVELLSADAVKIAPGTPVIFTRWGGEKPLDGRVQTVEPLAFTKVSALGVEEQRVNVVAAITSPQQEWQRLGAGYRVEASFVLWNGEDVLQVPASSLFRYQDGWAVFTIQNGLAARKKVEIGQRNGMAAQILSGIDDGELVITHPDSSLEDGKPVTAPG